MNYETELAKISRSKVDLLVLKMDYCTRTFGSLPCAATGAKCYNTYPTCKYISAFYKTTTDYLFSNIDKPLPFDGVKPYITSVGNLPTEIKEKDTVTKRLKIVLADEPDNDVGVDPYRSTRSTIQGTYWKKFLARNPNYKGRIVELYRGFVGMTESEITSRDPSFVGVIDNIKLNGNEVTFEAVDLLRSLKDVKYPLNIGIALTENLGKEFEASNQTAMLALNEAIVGDFCHRTDFINMTNVVGTLVIGGGITSTRTYHIYAYDTNNQPYGYVQHVETITSGSWTVELTWNDFSTASYYRVFIESEGGYLQTSTASISDDGSGYTTGNEPDECRLIYELTNLPSSSLENWAERHNDNYLGIYASSDEDLDNLESSGYLQIGKEVIYYGDRGDELIAEVVRAAHGTKSERYPIGTPVKRVVYYDADNPFTIFKNLLGTSIPYIYIDSQFTTYESAWSSINFSSGPIIKAASLADIYFQAVDALNCISWQGDDGKIKIVKREARPGGYAQITDYDIVKDSVKIDLNESSRKTRWGLSWNRVDYTKSLTDDEAYQRYEMLIDSTAEGANSYGDEIQDDRYCSWINDDCGTESQITTYLATLLGYRKNRTNQAQEAYKL